MPRYRALVEYDGSAYYGFQRQRQDQPTIQGEFENALHQVSHTVIPVTGAGRTDSGVHALGQVVSFAVEWKYETAVLQRAINANLPDDIVVLQLEEVPVNFHPRFDARSRAYKYYIYNAAIRSPIHRTRNWFVPQPLNLQRMNEAAANLVGGHDFATFGQPPQGENTIREVLAARWQQEGSFFIFYIQANAFLYRMVRSLVGSMKLVGDGTWNLEDFLTAFEARNRSRAGMIAPAQGLYLVSVTYDE